MKLKKVLDIVNSEDAILALYKDGKKNFFLCSLLSSGAGSVYYSTSTICISMLAQSKLTINQVFEDNDDLLVTLDRGEKIMCLKDEFSNKLQCGDAFLKDLPRDMVNDKFVTKYSLL